MVSQRISQLHSGELPWLSFYQNVSLEAELLDFIFHINFPLNLKFVSELLLVTRQKDNHSPGR